jgi:hypothetical protein
MVCRHAGNAARGPTLELLPGRRDLATGVAFPAVPVGTLTPRPPGLPALSEEVSSLPSLLPSEPGEHDETTR